MRFKRLDLNLLVALDALLSEANVSRAADRLCLSQSATSGALARLREYFEDDLLVQVGRKMVLTPRAQGLAGKVRAALVQIDGTIIQAPEFNPSTIKREIKIIASDSVLISALQGALNKIAQSAPGLVMTIEHQGRAPQEKLERGEVDLLLMPDLYLSADHPSTPYYDDDYVVVAWEHNSWIGDTISEEEFFNARHAAVKFSTFIPSYENWFMKHRVEERQIVVQAGSFASIPYLIQNTDLIGMMHRSLATKFQEMMPIKIIECPVELPSLKQYVQWHAFTDGDECLAWVRDIILSTVKPPKEIEQDIRKTDTDD